MVSSDPGGRSAVKVRIVEALQGRVDGVRLDRFLVGQIYEVHPALGAWLIAMGAALAVGAQPHNLLVR